MEYAIGIGIGLVLGLAIGFVIARSQSAAMFGGPAGLELAKKTAARAGADAEFAKKLDQLFNPPPVKPAGDVLRLLGLLQREARLLDFLLENVAPYDDSQIGASVRDIHAKSQSLLKKYLVLEPVMTQEEGSRVTVQAGFDPAAVRLVGNVSGQPPFHGTLQHAGWRVKSHTIPKPADGQDEFILTPAEVDLA